MASSTRIALNRRRSRSTSIPSARAPIISSSNQDDVHWRHGTKRAHPLSPTSPRKWEDVDLWRRGKPASTHTSGPTSAPPTPLFACTPSEFNLFPPSSSSSSRPSGSSRRGVPPPIDGADPADLTRLRSDAFWELRRSVEESGEGLVRRMRDYESARARGAAYSKAKASLRRGRKRHALRPRRAVCAAAAAAEGAGTDGDEEVQIYAGEGGPSEGGPRKKRAFSLGTVGAFSDAPSPFMDLDVGSASSPGTTLYSGPSGSTSEDGDFDVDDESMDLVDDSPLSLSLSALTPSSSSWSPSSPSSFVSLPPHFEFFGQPLAAPVIPTSSRSEKAIAALSLAIANGAGGLNDYGALRAVEPVSIIEDSHVGELWH